MDNSKFAEYVTIFADLYNEGKLIVKWGNESAGLRSLIDIEEELNKYGDEYTEADFVKAAFVVIEISKQICTGLARQIEPNKRFDLVAELFLNKSSIREHILVQSASNSNVLDDFSYDILTKRDKSNIKNVLAHTAILNLFVRDVDNRADEPVVKKVSLEVTSNDIEKLIANLHDVLDDLKALK